jgi:cysteinyl-tRNA synthetase
MFTCGPSIYNRPHIGNYRTFLFEDVLQRYLEARGYDVQRLINFTDVEDKAIAEARQNGLSLAELTEPVAQGFFDDCRLLRIKLPETAVSRSSTSIDQAVALIRRLLDKGIAYWHAGNVYYDPLKFKGFGKLYGLDMSRWPKKKIRFHKDTYRGHRWNMGDFILWKGRDKGEPDAAYWDTELGQGRPSWNVQDPGMITKHLGYQIDISCGGVDNLYRHHDYNIAVIEGVSGKTFARYWLHGEHVLADGVKMSKSRGNIVTIEDLLIRGFSPHHVRFYLIYGHYRNKLNLNEEHLMVARGKVDTLRALADRIATGNGGGRRSHPSASSLIHRLGTEFESHMNNDLNVKGAVDAIFELLQQLSQLAAEGGLSRSDCRNVEKKLTAIDAVWQVLDGS